MAKPVVKSSRKKTTFQNNFEHTFEIESPRHANKLLADKMQVKEAIDEIFGVQATPTRRPLPYGERSIHQLILRGPSKQKIALAQSGVERAIESIAAQEEAAKKVILNDPKAFAKKVDLLLTDKDRAEMLGMLELAAKDLRKDRKGQQRAGKVRSASEDSNLQEFKDNIIKAQKELVDVKEASVARNLLGGLIGTLPSDISGILPYYSDSATKVRDTIGNYVNSLNDRIKEDDTVQIAETARAKKEFSDEELSTIGKEIDQSLDEKNVFLDPQEKKLLLNRICRVVYEATDDAEHVRLTLKSAIPLTPAEEAERRKQIEERAWQAERQKHALCDGRYVPRTANQIEQVKAMRANGVTIITGAAGTGKTMTAVAFALDEQKRTGAQIILLRPAKEINEEEELGTLPGGEVDKIGIKFRGALRNMEEIIGREELLKKLGEDPKAPYKKPSVLDKILPKQDIVMMSLANIRGDTLAKRIIIVEEAQNANRGTLKGIATRPAINTKIIIAGDTTQTDLPTHDARGNWLSPAQMPGLPELIHISRNKDYVGIVQYGEGDIVRSELAKQMVELYREADATLAETYAHIYPGYSEQKKTITSRQVVKPLANGSDHSNDNGHVTHVNGNVPRLGLTS